MASKQACLFCETDAMLFGWFLYQDREVFGVVEDGRVSEVVRTGETYEMGLTFGLGEARILPPVLPTKIVGIGLNYHAHAVEMGKPTPSEPLLFLKPATALIGPGDPIVVPPQSARVDFEGELAVIIGRRCRNVTPAQALEYVLGYTCFNDVTARDLQSRDVQYTRAKGFDTFAPVGPFLATDLSPSRLRIRTFVNGVLKQEASTSDMIFSVPEIIAFVSSVMTLLPGDILATGTPPGVGPLKGGDVVAVEIDSIGRLENPVIAGSEKH
jgi:2-keto-4-pentenoate hydratase/2-oxohepta-3-ene-1,7-dioic acid hydratase in catechol pathway